MPSYEDIQTTEHRSTYVIISIQNGQKNGLLFLAFICWLCSSINLVQVPYHIKKQTVSCEAIRLWASQKSANTLNIKIRNVFEMHRPRK